MTANGVLIQASPEQLSELILSGIREELKKFQFNFNQKSNNDELMTRKQVCDFLGCSFVSLWNFDKKNLLIPIRIGRSVRYKRQDVEAFINKKSA